MKDKIIIGLIIAVVCLGLFTCRDNGSSDGLKDRVEELEVENEALEGTIFIYKDSILLSNEKIAEIEEKRDTIIRYRTITRRQSSNRITEAENSTEKEADSIINETFESSIDNLVQVREHDSLKLEHRSLTDLYNGEVEEKMELQEINRYQDTTIVSQRSIIVNQEEGLQIGDLLLKKENKKKPILLLKGFGIGVGSAAILFLITGGK